MKIGYARVSSNNQDLELQKDINDMILAGHNVQDIVESNTYKGLQAELKFNLWKKNDQQHYSSKAKRYSRST